MKGNYDRRPVDGRGAFQDQNNRKYASTNRISAHAHVIIRKVPSQTPCAAIVKIHLPIRLENSRAIDFITAVQASG